MLSGEMNREGTKNTKRLQFSYSKTPIAPRRTSENFGICNRFVRTIFGISGGEPEGSL